MGHVTRETDWCNIDIDTRAGQVLMSERWMYNWIPAGYPVWTRAEQLRFHRQCDLAIWAAWSNRVRLKVTGASPFAQRFAHGTFGINLDIRWVLAKPHWTVNVTKVDAGKFYQSQVIWPTHNINLGSRDFETVTRNLGQGVRRQVTVAHEFGHAAGNSWVFKNGDEYPKPTGTPSPHVADQRSIMHIGHALRARHFKKLVEELNTMIPQAHFAVASVG